MFGMENDPSLSVGFFRQNDFNDPVCIPVDVNKNIITVEVPVELAVFRPGVAFAPVAKIRFRYAVNTRSVIMHVVSQTAILAEQDMTRRHNGRLALRV